MDSSSSGLACGSPLLCSASCCGGGNERGCVSEGLDTDGLRTGWKGLGEAFDAGDAASSSTAADGGVGAAARSAVLTLGAFECCNVGDLTDA